MPLETAPVSVVIPAYNAGPSIERALSSIAAQTLPPAEIIVVDDGSSDDTAARAKAMQSSVSASSLVVIEQENAGAGAARNRAIQAATQKYIAFLDADDEWMPEKLERSIAVMNDGHYTLVAHDYLDQTPDGDVHVFCADRFNEGPDPYTSLYLKGYIPSISVVVKRDAVMKVGGFDETLRNAQDFELWLKILANPQNTFTVFNEPLARYYHTPGGIMTHTERRITCCSEIAKRYLTAIEERHSSPLGILQKRIINIYFEAFVTYRNDGKIIRAGIIPFRCIGALLKFGTCSAFDKNHCHRFGGFLAICFYIWTAIIMGLYFWQFKDFGAVILNQLERAFGG